MTTLVSISYEQIQAANHAQLKEFCRNYRVDIRLNSSSLKLRTALIATLGLEPQPEPIIEEVKEEIMEEIQQEVQEEIIEEVQEEDDDISDFGLFPTYRQVQLATRGQLKALCIKFHIDVDLNSNDVKLRLAISDEFDAPSYYRDDSTPFPIKALNRDAYDPTQQHDDDDDKDIDDDNDDYIDEDNDDDNDGYQILVVEPDPAIIEYTYEQYDFEIVETAPEMSITHYEVPQVPTTPFGLMQAIAQTGYNPQFESPIHACIWVLNFIFMSDYTPTVKQLVKVGKVVVKEVLLEVVMDTIADGLNAIIDPIYNEVVMRK